MKLILMSRHIVNQSHRERVKHFAIPSGRRRLRFDVTSADWRFRWLSLIPPYLIPQISRQMEERRMTRVRRWKWRREREREREMQVHALHSRIRVLSCNYVTQRRYTTTFYNKGASRMYFRTAL